MNFRVKVSVRVLVQNLNGPKKSILICVKLITLLYNISLNSAKDIKIIIIKSRRLIQNLIIIIFLLVLK